MRFSKLSLNYSKISYMIIGPSSKRPYGYNVRINDNTISQTNSQMPWGVY